MCAEIALKLPDLNPLFTKYQTIMKLKIMLLVAAFLVTSIVTAYSVPYCNKDSKTYTFKVKINGSEREMTFKGSTSGTVNCPPMADVAEIQSSCGWVKVKNGQKITIKDVYITLN